MNTGLTVVRDARGRVVTGNLNPYGNPGAKHFGTLFKQAIRNIADGELESADVLIVKKIIAKAKAGDLKAAEIIMDRTDGKISPETEPQGNVTFNIIQFGGDRLPS